jgi:hypothetical protein
MTKMHLIGFYHAIITYNLWLITYRCGSCIKTAIAAAAEHF